MSKITDPDNLNNGVEVVFDTTLFTIRLLITGNMTIDGASLKCIYSFIREQWKTQADLIKHGFPLLPIDGPSGTQFLLLYGWDWYDTDTIKLVKDGGWSLRDDVDSLSKEEWMNINILTPFSDQANDTAQYRHTSGGTLIDADTAGAPNQAVKIYGDASHGNIDNRSFFKIYINEYGKKSNSYDLVVSQNITELTFKQYGIPLENPVDIYITDPVGLVAIYGGITVGGGYIIIDGNYTMYQIYDYVQYWKSLDENIEELLPLSTYDGSRYNLENGYVLALMQQLSGTSYVSGNVEITSEINLMNIDIIGILYVDIGSNSVLTFSGVIVSVDIVNINIGGYTLTINSVDGSELVTTTPGTGTGEVNIIVSTILTLIDLPENIEIRLRQGSKTLDHIQSVTATGIYQYVYNYLYPLKIKIAYSGAGIIEAGFISYTLTSESVTIPMTFKPDPSYEV